MGNLPHWINDRNFFESAFRESLTVLIHHSRAAVKFLQIRPETSKSASGNRGHGLGLRRRRMLLCDGFACP